MEFPYNFWWGAATSGPQSEGNYGKLHDNVMDYWYKEKPEDFFNQVGPERASDFFIRYKEDFQLMKSIGFNSFRTSIQWGRLIKDFETGEADSDAVKFYLNLIEEARNNDIELVLNLHHFDMPIELLQQYGGWESKYVIELFVKYAETCFNLFGDKVRYWTTFNEPMVIPEAGYLYGFHYPNFIGKGKKAMQVIYNINLASAKAINLYKKKKYNGKIGIILNLTPTYPRSQSVEDITASRFVDDLFNHSFLDPAVKGVFPDSLVQTLAKDRVLWKSTKSELIEISTATVDFLGVNYYHPKRVKTRETELKYQEWIPDRYFEEFKKENVRINTYRGWEIYPKAIYEIALTIRDDYGNIPWFISENGMGVENEERFIDESGIIQDDYRIDFYKEHLAWLAKAIDEGSHCFGYHAWTAFDCWSWNNSYKNRYGFISVNLDTQKRTIKKSGYWYKELSDSNGYFYDLKHNI